MKELPRLRLHDGDWRWYFDKYLASSAAISATAAVLLLSERPLAAADLHRGLRFSAIAALCMAFSPRRKLVASIVFGFVAMRGLVGGILTRSPTVMLVGTAAAVALLLMTRWANSGGEYKLPYSLKPAGVVELAFDVLFFWRSLPFSIGSRGNGD